MDGLIYAATESSNVDDRDRAERSRFISSRVTVNGPTMGDVGGASILNGSGYWAEQFLAARRL